MQSKFITSLIVLFFLIIFAIQNTAPITLSFLFFSFTVPLVVVMIIFVVIGIGLSMALYALKDRRYHNIIRKKNQTIRNLKKEVSTLSSSSFGKGPSSEDEAMVDVMDYLKSVLGPDVIVEKPSIEEYDIPITETTNEKPTAKNPLKKEHEKAEKPVEKKPKKTKTSESTDKDDEKVLKESQEAFNRLFKNKKKGKEIPLSMKKYTTTSTMSKFSLKDDYEKHMQEELKNIEDMMESMGFNESEISKTESSPYEKYIDNGENISNKKYIEEIEIMDPDALEAKKRLERRRKANKLFLGDEPDKQEKTVDRIENIGSKEKSSIENIEDRNIKDREVENVKRKEKSSIEVIKDRNIENKEIETPIDSILSIYSQYDNKTHGKDTGFIPKLPEEPSINKPVSKDKIEDEKIPATIQNDNLAKTKSLNFDKTKTANTGSFPPQRKTEPSDRLKAIESGFTISSDDSARGSFLESEGFIKVSNGEELLYGGKEPKSTAQDTFSHDKGHTDINIQLDEETCKKQVEMTMSFDKTAFTTKLLSPELVNKQFNWKSENSDNTSNLRPSSDTDPSEKEEKKEKKGGFLKGLFTIK